MRSMTEKDIHNLRKIGKYVKFVGTEEKTDETKAAMELSIVLNTLKQIETLLKDIVSKEIPAPITNIEVEAPNVEINPTTPNIEIKVPNIEVKPPDIIVENKFDESNSKNIEILLKELIAQKRMPAEIKIDEMLVRGKEWTTITLDIDRDKDGVMNKVIAKKS